MHQKPQISFPAQFVLLLGLLGAFMVFGSILIATLGSSLLDIPLSDIPVALNRPENANISRLLNTLATMVVFLLPAIIFARIITPKPFRYLGFNTVFNNKQLLLVVLITFSGMIVSGSLGMLNEHIYLPEKWMTKARALEETYKNAMMNMATMKHKADYLLALLVMALAPAVFEEVLFRGSFQQLLVGWTKSAWIGIFITSMLFSAIHFSYFGFLPRAALGMILGFIFYYTRNLWLSILLHFLNNAFIVSQLYIMSLQGKPVEKAIDDTTPIWWGALALAALVYIFKLLRKESRLLLAGQPPFLQNQSQE